jgi:phosphoribosylglycinamide formyltransferase-1
MAGGIGAGPRTVVLVSGNGSNLQALVDAVLAGRVGVRLAGVVSDRPGAGGLARATAAGIPAGVVDYAAAGSRDAFGAALAHHLATLAPDLLVLAGFMRVLPPGFVEGWAGRMLNVHPSLLPAYPGLHTHRRALADGAREHGATVHFVTPALDAGPAIIQYRVPVGPDDTEAGLRARVQQGEHRIYPQALAWLAAGRLALADGAAWLDGRRLPGPVVVDEAVCG